MADGGKGDLAFGEGDAAGGGARRLGGLISWCRGVVAARREESWLQPTAHCCGAEGWCCGQQHVEWSWVEGLMVELRREEVKLSR